VPSRTHRIVEGLTLTRHEDCWILILDGNPYTCLRIGKVWLAWRGNRPYAGFPVADAGNLQGCVQLVKQYHEHEMRKEVA
jgi:hypothetical protein